MELQGLSAFGFVVLVFLIGAFSAMVFTVWVFLVRMKKFGYTFNDKLEVVALPVEPVEAEVTDGPQEEDRIV